MLFYPESFSIGFRLFSQACSAAICARLTQKHEHYIIASVALVQLLNKDMSQMEWTVIITLAIIAALKAWGGGA
jgi:hypothetical protein